MPASARSAPAPPPRAGPEARHQGCAVGELFAMLGRPHMLSVLHTFCSSSEPIRFRELESRLHIPPKTLSQRLHTLVEKGFLARHAYSEIPPRVEYSATHKLKELLPIFEELDRWAKQNTMTATPVVSVIGAVPARGRAPAGSVA